MKNWATALNIDETELNSWRNQVPYGESLLYWCLTNKKINEKAYFKWAINYYGLAFAKDDFFKTPPHLELWDKIRTVANWSPQLIPIIEWDGTIFIACIEPLNDVNWSFPTRFILARPKALQYYWLQLNSSIPKTPVKATKTTKRPPEHSVIAEAPPEHSVVAKAPPEYSVIAKAPPEHSVIAEVPPTPTAIVAPPSEDNIVAKQHGEKPLPPTLPQAEEPPPPIASEAPEGLEMPEGLEFDLPPTPSAEDTANSAPKKSMEAQGISRGLEIPDGLEMPEGMELFEQDGLATQDIQQPIAEGHDVFDQEDLKTQDIDKPISEGHDVFDQEDLKTQDIDKPISEGHDVFDQDDVKTGIFEMPEGWREEVQSNKKANTETPPVATNLSTAENKNQNSSISKNDSGLKEACSWLYEQLKSDLTQQMVMRLAGSQFLAQDHDTSWSKDGSSYMVEINEPTFLKVVYRTRQSYHGYLAENRKNQEFFHAWGIENLPEHVTAVPILVKGRIWGAYVGIAGKEAFNNAVLAKAEKAISQFTHYIEKLESMAA